MESVEPPTVSTQLNPGSRYRVGVLKVCDKNEKKRGQGRKIRLSVDVGVVVGDDEAVGRSGGVPCPEESQQTPVGRCPLATSSRINGLRLIIQMTRLFLNRRRFRGDSFIFVDGSMSA